MHKYSQKGLNLLDIGSILHINMSASRYLLAKAVESPVLANVTGYMLTSTGIGLLYMLGHSLDCT